MAILLVASEAAELKGVASRLNGLRKLKWPVDYAFEGVLESRRILLTANGAGPQLAARAVETAIRAAMVAELSSSRLEAVISTGFCGALDPNLREGQLVVATEVLNAANPDKFSTAAIASDRAYVSGPVLTQDRVANNASEKASLHATGAIAVDMESAGVAARAQRAGLPFCCIKVVSDRADESFPFDLNRMRTLQGRISRGKIILHALTHPNLVPALFRLKKRSEMAAALLGDFIVSCRIIADTNAASAEPHGA